MENMRIAFGEDPFKAKENLKIENGYATQGATINFDDCITFNIPNGAKAISIAPNSPDLIKRT